MGSVRGTRSPVNRSVSIGSLSVEGRWVAARTRAPYRWAIRSASGPSLHAKPQEHRQHPVLGRSGRRSTVGGMTGHWGTECSSRHDDLVLVQVEGAIRSPDGTALVEVRTSVGTAIARWCGDVGATSGAHHVEWELDEEFRWGLNCSQAAVEQPRLCQNERGVFLRGRLGLEETASVPAFAHVELAGALIVLGRIDALPEGMAGSWVELHVKPDKVKVYPYLV